MSGLPPDLNKRLHDTLVICSQFDTDENLRAIFVDERISPWRNTLPQANSRVSRVQLTINSLYEQQNTRNENALVLLLQVLCEHVNPGNRLCHELSALADEVEKCFDGERSRSTLHPEPLLTKASELPLSHLPETILIPAGEFWMGSADDDPNAQPNEKPQHRLFLPDYEIGKYPVTNAQYLEFVQEARYTLPVHWIENQIPPSKDMHPVVCVNFLDAQAYCKWLSQKTGRDYRLPSEQEWEKAARGPFPDDRRYPWGNGWHENFCNTNEMGCGDTTPVTAFESINKSPFGVIGMSGNVWEWTSSVYAPYKNAVYSSDASFSGLKHTVRGGACTIGASSARISCRGRYNPRECKPHLGFRVAMSATEQ